MTTTRGKASKTWVGKLARAISGDAPKVTRDT